MWHKADPYLVVGLSGRALMQSARCAGLATVVLDLFADSEVRRDAYRWARVGALPDGFDGERLLEAAQRLAPPAHCAGVVYGAGFEAHPDWLSLLADGRPLLGNPPEVLASVGDPHHFFAVLDRLGVPHPPVRFRAPDDPDGWLAKRAHACGGTHVLPAARAPRDAARYYQRRMNGDVVSVLFLTDGRDLRILGTSLQWQAADGALPYQYAGAVSHHRLGSALLGEIRLAIGDLVRWWGLRGLNGVDLVVDGQDYYVLEVNPRPTATVELYQQATGHSLFDAHVRACHGLPLPELRLAGQRHAHRVLFANRDLCIPRAFVWPRWSSDRPVADTRVRRGEPLCTIHAAGASHADVCVTLRERAGRLVAALTSEPAPAVVVAGEPLAVHPL